MEDSLQQHAGTGSEHGPAQGVEHDAVAAAVTNISLSVRRAPQAATYRSRTRGFERNAPCSLGEDFPAAHQTLQNASNTTG